MHHPISVSYKLSFHPNVDQIYVGFIPSTAFMKQLVASFFSLMLVVELLQKKRVQVDCFNSMQLLTKANLHGHCDENMQSLLTHVLSSLDIFVFYE